jgi:ATP-dependent DNA helicase RecG
MSSSPTPAAKKAAAKTPTALQKALQKLGLRSDLDFALHLPLRYEDETQITPLAQAHMGQRANVGQEVQIAGVVRSTDVLLRGRRQLVIVLEEDGSAEQPASCQLRFFNFYPNQQKAWSVGTRLRVRGVLQGGRFEAYMLHPAVKIFDAQNHLPTALTPVYPASAGLPQAYLRKAISGALQRCRQTGLLVETLPDFSMPNRPNLAWNLPEALSFLHQPSPQVALAALEDKSHPAWQRLIAEELLAQQLAQQQAKRERSSHAALPLPAQKSDGVLADLRQRLPFALTAAQSRVVAEIAADLARNEPMHRLLQGDVGSGKTVVAALAAAQAIDAGAQCALLAPTEILATQHFRKLADWLAPILAERGLQLAWLLGSQKKKAKAENLAAIANGQAALIVGTHALLQGGVEYAKLGLVVIDEQHRFGVAQRLALRSKGSTDAAGQVREPHVLMMSATPIPRTLAMSYYADLDVSTIDELPPGRTPIATSLLAKDRYAELVQRLHNPLGQGRQVYWVCPLIEESEALDLTHATERFEALQAALPGVAVALLHARLPVAEKQAIMAAFAAGQVQVLVSTTVIEVGVDVPNASIMVIEHAERFGLSQLHQLRGRVGRGAAASSCVLVYDTGESGRLSQTARERLKAMQETNDGFEIARRDLAIRGPGEFLGARQSGAPLLRFADLERDAAWLDWARATAVQMWQNCPDLAEQHLGKWMGFRSEYLKA